MRMQGSGVAVRQWLGAVLLTGLATPLAEGKPAICEKVTITGEVRYGQSFAADITPNLRFLFEAIQSGWIVRVVDAHAPREPHDYAELATPPYQSVTPLAVSTDFSFRAQDALAWNPRRFRFAASAAEFQKLKTLYEPALHGDAKATGAIASLAMEQPTAELTVLEAHLSAGTNDQTGAASMVASHLSATPYTVDAGAGSALGRIHSVRFRVVFSLPASLHAASGASVQRGICEGFKGCFNPQPTPADARSVRSK